MQTDWPAGVLPEGHRSHEKLCWLVVSRATLKALVRLDSSYVSELSRDPSVGGPDRGHSREVPHSESMSRGFGLPQRNETP